MWEILRRKAQVTSVTALLLAATGGAAIGQSTNVVNQNISGFNLPGVTLPSGTDEIRAADGTTCRSSIVSNGAYMDLGVMGNPDTDTVKANFAAYGRIVIPLGEKPKRLDCNRLYNVEVARLELELKLAQMGFAQGIAPVSEQIEPGTPTGTIADDWGDEASVSKAQDTVKKTEIKKTEVKKTVAKKTIRTAKLARRGSDEAPAWVTDDWSDEGMRN